MLSEKYGFVLYVKKVNKSKSKWYNLYEERIIVGMIYKVLCQCGYNKELNLGCGLSSCNVNLVNKVFSKDELEEFNKRLSSNEIKNFIMENVAVICDNCNEIQQATKLNAKLKSGEDIEVITKCSICHEDVAILKDKYICPVCRKDMKLETTGFWD